jgi:hypothetical protein
MIRTSSPRGEQIFAVDLEDKVLRTRSAPRSGYLDDQRMTRVRRRSQRYFFPHRVRDVDLEKLTIEQDQNYHADWTFAVNAFVGYEF